MGYIGICVGYVNQCMSVDTFQKYTPYFMFEIFQHVSTITTGSVNTHFDMSLAHFEQDKNNLIFFGLFYFHHSDTKTVGIIMQRTMPSLRSTIKIQRQLDVMSLASNQLRIAVDQPGTPPDVAIRHGRDDTIATALSAFYHCQHATRVAAQSTRGTRQNRSPRRTESCAPRRRGRRTDRTHCRPTRRPRTLDARGTRRASRRQRRRHQRQVRETADGR